MGALTHTRRTVADIAGSCGYAAQAHFTRIFVRQIGITPSQYRRAEGGARVGTKLQSRAPGALAMKPRPRDDTGKIFRRSLRAVVAQLLQAAS